MNNNNYESEGEEYIADYLRQVSIKYVQQYRIANLKGDNAQHRIADFYLPSFKVFIEFEGQINNQERRNQYLEKRKVYSNNNIPCVYLYPENLGFIEFAFDKRIQVEMRKNNLISELKRYHLKKLIMYNYEKGIFLVLFILLGIYYTDVDSTKQALTRVFAIIGIMYQAIKITQAYYKIFITNKQPLVLPNS